MLYRARDRPGKHDRLEGVRCSTRSWTIDQSPDRPHAALEPGDLHQGVRPDPRAVRAARPRHAMRGYKPGRFSFNVSGGRCEACAGRRARCKIEMHFLPDVYVHLRGVQGPALQPRDARGPLQGPEHRRRARPDRRARRCDLFANIPRIAPHARHPHGRRARLHHPRPVRHHALGRRGAAHQARAELARRATGNTLYILDEPTTGLHFDDAKSCSRCSTRSWTAATPSS